MKKLLPVLFLLLFLVSFAQAQQLQKTLLINEELPTSHRDEEGRINLYFYITGISTKLAAEELVQAFYVFGGVEEMEILDRKIDKTSFRCLFFVDAQVNYFKKLFITNGINQSIFFGESYPVDDLTGEIILKHIEL